MYFKRFLLITFLGLIGHLTMAEQSMSTKDILIKTAKIMGYTAGIVIPSKVLSHQFQTYDPSTWIYKPEHPSFVRFLAVDPMIETIKTFIEHRKRNTENTKMCLEDAYHEVLCNISLVTCIGYSAHGLYNELKPVVKQLLRTLNNKVNPEHKK